MKFETKGKNELFGKVYDLNYNLIHNFIHGYFTQKVKETLQTFPS